MLLDAVGGHNVLGRSFYPARRRGWRGWEGLSNVYRIISFDARRPWWEVGFNYAVDIFWHINNRQQIEIGIDTNWRSCCVRVERTFEWKCEWMQRIITFGACSDREDTVQMILLGSTNFVFFFNSKGIYIGFDGVSSWELVFRWIPILLCSVGREIICMSLLCKKQSWGFQLLLESSLPQAKPPPYIDAGRWW